MLRWCWLAVLSWVVWAGVPVRAEPLPLQPVRVEIQQGGVASEIAPADALPLRWDRQFRHGGAARVEFIVPAFPSGEAYGLYLPRVGNTFRVRLGAEVIHSEDASGPRWRNTVHLPRQVDLPPGAWPGDRLVVEFDAVAGADGGLSEVLFGTRAEVRALYAQQVYWRMVASIVVASASLVLGLLGLLVWYHQREGVYLYYGLAEVMWSLRTAGYYLTDRFLLPWPWWGVLMNALYCGAIACICYFGLLLAHRGGKPWKQLVQAFVVGSAAMIVVSFAFDQHAWWRQWRTAYLVLALCCAAVVVHAAVRQRSREAIVMSAATGVTVAIGLRDWVVITLATANYTSFPWVTYAWPLFGIVMAVLLASRLRAATRAQELHAQELATRLRQQEEALAQAFARSRAQTAHAAATEERQRVLQDMHDGVGHELLGALQTAHEAGTSREIVAQQIQRAMDHLKLTVDVLQEGAQDISTVLGLLRYRLGPRLQAAGIAMEWRVDAIASPEGWTTRHARDLQMLLYEAFTNMLAHSRADRVRFSATLRPDGRIAICLEDNGRGLAPAAHTGNGRQTMAARAQRLGGELSVANGADPGYPGVRVEVVVAAGLPPATEFSASAAAR